MRRSPLASAPIEVHVINYDIEHQGERAIPTGDATASREGVSELLREFVVGRTFVLPERAAGIVKLLM